MNKQSIPTKEMRATARLEKGMRADVTVRDFALINDEPAEIGGTDLGPSPTETALQALCSCVSMVVRVASKKHGVPIASIETEAVATFDIRGVMFQTAVEVPFRKVDLTLKVAGAVAESDLDPIRNAIRDFCPVHKLFEQAGTEVTQNWVLLDA